MAAGIDINDLKRALYGAFQAYGATPEEIAAFQTYATGSGFADRPQEVQSIMQKTGFTSQQLGEMADALRAIEGGWRGNANDLRDLYDQWTNLASTAQERQIGAKKPEDTSGITNQIQKFIDTLAGPLAGDPVYQQIARQAVNAAQAQAGRAGISGRSGLAATNAAAITQATSAPYYAARQQAMQGALGLQSQRDLGLGALQQGYEQMQNQLAQQRWAAQQSANQATGSLVGGTLGTIGGALLSPLTAGMSLKVLPGAGAYLGGGAGGMGAPPMPSYSRGGGLGGRNPYTGY